METEGRENVNIKELLEAPKLTECRKVLCIQPHPDDNEVGMGGIIALLADRGCELHYVTVTDGRLGDQNSPLTSKELAEVRKQEAEASGRLLGATAGIISDLFRHARQ